ncbi:MAG: 3-oxoacyl-ACP reductase FabG [Bacteroidales bacterium]|nr:3-oxoacyl-ACP reductase FabG [Bacteroidales bacterium]
MMNALVTGGSRGIGRSISYKLSELGYHVLINYRSNEDEALKTIESIQENNGSGEILKFDVANIEEVEEVLGEWRKMHEGEYIEVLVNNAGFSNDMLMVWMKKEDWTNVIDINLNGFFYVTKFLLQDMIINKFGRIINIVSLSGIKGLPGQTNYSAAKAGVIGATKALAQEVAKKKVTVNAVAPGFISTDMTKDLDEKELKRMIPTNRFGKPDEVADLVQFLASKKSSYITGEVININGGLYT